MSSSPPHSSRTPVRDHVSPPSWDATFSALDLTALGWVRAVRSAPAELLGTHPDCAPARVARVDRGRLLLVADGSGTLRHVRDRADDGGPPSIVGDWVLVDAAGTARVRLPRSGTIARRRDTDSAAPQVLAANVDVVFVAEPLDPGRAINEARVARMAALAAAGGADACVLLTGADRLDDHAGSTLPADVAGVRTIATSAIDGRGLEAVCAELGVGMTATVVGPSGSGKSTLVNALVGGEVLATAARRGSGTGRHTTSVARLVPLPWGALLVDTPGIRGVGMHAGVDTGALTPTAIDELAERCRFRDCRHDGEPGCAVATAIETGDLPVDAISTWRKLEREALRERARGDDRLRRELQAGWRGMSREVERARRRGEIVERRR